MHLPDRRLLVWLSVFASLATVMVMGSAASAQDGKWESETLRSPGDGWPIHISYYPADDKKHPGGVQNAGVVVLLAGEAEGESRLVWDKKPVVGGNERKTFAEILNKEEGYAVVSVDLRKQGESVPVGGTASKIDARDYRAMIASDMEAVKKFLFEKHQERQLNMNKTAIIAPGSMAVVAASFAAIDWAKRPYDDAPVMANRTPRGQDVRALVFLSPDSHAGNLPINKGIMSIRDERKQIAVLTLVGAKDSKASNSAEKMMELLTTNKDNKDRMYLEEFPNKFAGTDLIGPTNTKAIGLILGFLNKHLKELDSPWRDRRSALDRG